MLTVKSLGLQENSKLLTAIALTFALNVLDVYEKEYPTDKKLYDALEYCTNVLLEPEFNQMILGAWIGYDVNEICSRKIHTASTEAYAAARTVLNAFYISTYEGDSNIKELEALVETAAMAKQKNVDQYVHDNLFSILPLILEYKVQNLEHFGDLETVWEYLTNEQKDLVIFNLDILAIRLRGGYHDFI